MFNYRGQLKVNLVDLADDADSQMHPTHERFLQNVTAHA